MGIAGNISILERRWNRTRHGEVGSTIVRLRVSAVDTPELWGMRSTKGIMTPRAKQSPIGKPQREVGVIVQYCRMVSVCGSR